MGVTSVVVHPARPPAPRQRVFTPSARTRVSPLALSLSPQKRRDRIPGSYRTQRGAVTAATVTASSRPHVSRPRPRDGDGRIGGPRRERFLRFHTHTHSSDASGRGHCLCLSIADRRPARHIFFCFFFFPLSSFFSPASTRSQPLADCTALSVSDLTPPADGIVFLPFSPVRVPPTVSFGFRLCVKSVC